MTYFYVAASGWIGVVLFGPQVLLPYLLGRGSLRGRLGLASAHAQPYLERMRPHYWLGYGLLGLSCVHAWMAMVKGHMGGVNLTGIWLATLALILLFAQLALGLYLQSPEPAAARAKVRRWHYWIMIASVGCLAAHVVLNK
ncbi:MAG TPA: hypothetical protein VK473_11910 [Terriglobales bacterium]|nr:hypothetical protein [Terriglobales bacterium]